MQIDRKVIKGCLKNNRKAQRKFYDLCFPVLMSVCMRYTKNEQDARAYVNAGFLKIISNLDKYDHEKPIDSWMCRIMINTIIDDYRHNKKYYEHEKHPHTNGELILNERQLTLNEGEARLVEDDIYRFIRQLPAKTAAVFNMYVIDGYNHSEIAEKLNMQEGTSKWHLSEARKQLKSMIIQTYKSASVKYE